MWPEEVAARDEIARTLDTLITLVTAHRKRKRYVPPSVVKKEPKRLRGSDTPLGQGVAA